MRGEGSINKEFVDKSVMDALKNIGLNLYERKLYTALLTKGTATAGELADLSGVPRARVYDVLETLADKGFVLIRNSRPISYVAIPPKEAITRAAKRLQEAMRRQIEKMEEFKESEHIEALERLHMQGMKSLDPHELVGMVRGKYSVLQHEESVIRNATSSINIITSERGLEEIYRVYSASIQEAAERGIKIRIHAPITERNKEIAEQLSEIADIKDLSAISDKAPYTRMVIADNKEVVMALTHEDEIHPSHHTSIWTASKNFAENFASKTFNLLWELADKD